LQKEWISLVYAFFEPMPRIVEIEGRRTHEFKCMACGCKATIRRFLDTKDARSTGNMRKHVRVCWGQEILDAADKAKDVSDVHGKIISTYLRNGSITTAFERKGKGKVTYSHRQHTQHETRGFQSLMKTGRPEYYIPSHQTVSRDVRLVFAHTRKHVAKILKEYDGKLNFSTDAWSSPNHSAFVAFCVHLERDGKPLSMLLDLVEVAKVRHLQVYYTMTCC
ncbi:hypothetical protein V8E55_007116, partial [Tylopilus felleus]